MGTLQAIAGVPAGRRAKWAVLVFWLIIVAVAGPLAGKLTGAEKNDSSAWLPAKAESTKVLDLQSRFQSPNIFTGVVVYARPSGLTSADRAKASTDAARFAQVAGVVPGQVAGPFFARDGQAIETIVPVNLGSEGWNGAPAAVTALRTIASAHANGLATHIAGPLGSAADSAGSFKGIDGTLLAATLVVVIVLLLITYRSPVLWLLPVMSAGIALTSAAALIYLLARHAGLTVNAQSAGILSVLVFGAGTDYALLLTARYREELRRHADRHEAMAVAMRRAGPAIIASGGTVILSLLTLTVAAWLQGTLTSAPDSQAAFHTIGLVRTAVHAVPGAAAMVGGNTAVTLDIATAADHDRDVIIPLILVLVFGILGLLLRAVIAPIMLIATVVLSYAAALGVSALFFNHVFHFGNADNSFPLFVFVFLVALGIDYNIFLMTRVREEAGQHGPRQGALTGLAATGGVITSAGAVLAGTFAALGTLPVTFLAELGFAVAFGVLLDTLVVRSVLVTALNLDLGRWTWWPSRLYRQPSPHTDILNERAATVR